MRLFASAEFFHQWAQLREHRHGKAGSCFRVHGIGGTWTGGGKRPTRAYVDLDAGQIFPYRQAEPCRFQLLDNCQFILFGRVRAGQGGRVIVEQFGQTGGPWSRRCAPDRF